MVEQVVLVDWVLAGRRSDKSYPASKRTKSKGLVDNELEGECQVYTL